MLDPGLLPAFVAVCLILTIVPGVNVFLLLRTTIQSGARAGMATLAGMSTVDVLLAALVASGVGVLLVQHPAALSVLRWLGAGYLVYLAGSLLQGLWRARRDAGTSETTGWEPGESRSAWSCYTRGVVCNITNPKRWLFVLTILPQFVGTATAPLAQLALLGGVFVLATVAWPLLLVLGSARLAGQLRRPRTRQWLDAVSAGVFLALSAGLLTT